MPLTFSQAKNVRITEYLLTLGCQPSKIRGSDYWYHSPFRQDKDPSFKVNNELNIWYDHGIGEGGTIIDLGIKLHQCTIHEFMQKLSNANFIYNFSLHQNNLKSQDSKLEILAVTDLFTPALTGYLESRGIAFACANKFCKEVSFKIGSKVYNAVGFQNISGGYELRNSWFKGSSSPKDISLINNHSRKVCVQEGFMDFLSVLTVNDDRIEQLAENSNFLVLNSLSLLDKSQPVLDAHDSIVLFLDNDTAGQKAKEMLMLKGVKFEDASKIYSSYKDVNEYLLRGTFNSSTLSRSRGIRR